MKNDTQARTRRLTTTPAVQGVVIGVLVALRRDGVPLVSYPGNPQPAAVTAPTTVRLGPSDVGRRVALLFEHDDPGRPLLVGCLEPAAGTATASQMQATLDGEDLTLVAPRRLVLRCGLASITLDADGTVEIRGKDLLSHSAGPNQIRGASIHLN